MESPSRHARYSRGQRDERSDDRQQPCDEDRYLPILMEEPVGEFQIALIEQGVAAIFLDKRPPTVCANLICQQRTDVASDRARGSRPVDVEDSGINVISGEWHDDFRWK